MYRVRYLNATGQPIDEGPFPLRQAEIQARTATTAGFTQVTILRDYEERIYARYATPEDLEGW